MHVQETSGLGVGLCGFLCVRPFRKPSYRHRSPAEPTCNTSPRYIRRQYAHTLHRLPPQKQSAPAKTGSIDQAAPIHLQVGSPA